MLNWLTHSSEIFLLCPISSPIDYCRYNPYLQTKNRVDQLRQLGHSVDKVEFIVMGGTFMALQDEYKDYFIRNLHDALSGHSSNNVDEAVRSVRIILSDNFTDS